MNFVNKGIPVVLVDAKQEFLDRGLAAIKKNYDISVSRKRMTPELAAKRFGLIKGTLEYGNSVLLRE